MNPFRAISRAIQNRLEAYLELLAYGEPDVDDD